MSAYIAATPSGALDISTVAFRQNVEDASFTVGAGFSSTRSFGGAVPDARDVAAAGVVSYGAPTLSAVTVARAGLYRVRARATAVLTNPLDGVDPAVHVGAGIRLVGPAGDEGCPRRLAHASPEGLAVDALVPLAAGESVSVFYDLVNALAANASTFAVSGASVEVQKV